MSGSSHAWSLGQQLAASGGMMLVTTLVHALGLTGISKSLNLDRERLKEMDFSWRSISLTSSMGIALLGLHALEVVLFALFYLVKGSVDTFERALYYSVSAYTTLGRTEDYFPAEWRLMSGIEALIGFLMIGWSTAFIASKASRMMPG